MWQAAVIFAVRRLIKPTWLNDRDQFLQPTVSLPEDFKNDCLIWMLFNNSNLTASSNDLVWNNKKWSVVNHFIPYTEAEVGAPERFESDFMVQYLAKMVLSIEALGTLNTGRELWKAYFTHIDTHIIREKFKLYRADVGWYQIRNAIDLRNKGGGTLPIHVTTFEEAYIKLTDKLKPLVYEYGFLRI